jgi:hypothetical protein
MKVSGYAKSKGVKSSDVVAILAAHQVTKTASHNVTDEEIAFLDAHYDALSSQVVHVGSFGEAIAAANVSIDDDNNDDNGISDDIELETEDNLGETPSSEPELQVHIASAPRGRGKARPQLSKADQINLSVAQELRDIQRDCSIIPRDHFTSVAVEGDKTARIYRPKVEVKDYQGTLYYVYPSVYTPEGLMAVTFADYEAYTLGRLQKTHMKFVSDELFERMRTLFTQYTDYSGTCSYPGCAITVSGKFSAGLDRKIQLIIRKAYLPPHSVVKGSTAAARVMENDRDDVMEMRKKCHVHFLLEALRAPIQRYWMDITVSTQELPQAERSVARQRLLIQMADAILNLAVQEA